ncbi:hypothetical protein F4821DRAFT_277890 [Hypoxylon rubiginosum]|uniref:Uncharacterized protein n=1 Tax=Hypoxylon rubiginosum TaxID=110542 RepID=A0ACC0DIY3_9PEZI|nr:hypothetical protein F4821DRAFT_277890 [Hypoxylon rubiginosum]
MPPHASESPAKRQSKWSPDEDKMIIDLRASGMKWEDISKRLPGRSAISCRLHYQNYLEKRAEWDEEKKNKLSRLYERCVLHFTVTPRVELNYPKRVLQTPDYLSYGVILTDEERNRFKEDMWKQVANEMGVPWRTVEKMHWQLGEVEIARRAGANLFNPNFSTSPSEGQHGGSKASPRHSHSRSQGGSSREANLTRGYSRGGTSSSSRPLASRRESVSHHMTVYPEHPPEDYGYIHHGMPLAPIQTQHQSPRPGTLPGVNELTTGISPYSTPAYAMPIPTATSAPSSTASPGPYMSVLGYPPLEPAGSKRRRSPEMSHISPEMSRRRHLDPRI